MVGARQVAVCLKGVKWDTGSGGEGFREALFYVLMKSAGRPILRLPKAAISRQRAAETAKSTHISRKYKLNLSLYLSAIEAADVSRHGSV